MRTSLKFFFRFLEYRNAYKLYEDLRDLRIMTKGYDFVFINWNKEGMPSIIVTRSDTWFRVQGKIHYCSDVNGLDIDDLDQGFSYNIQVTVDGYRYFARNVSVLPLGLFYSILFTITAKSIYY